MNIENFHEFISEPSNLYRVNYQELKSLVMQYPYSFNLRLLLLRKSRLEKHPDFERNLQMAATFALDRGLLFDNLQRLSVPADTSENFTLSEEYLELKDLSQLSILLEEKMDETQEAPPYKATQISPELTDTQKVSRPDTEFVSEPLVRLTEQKEATPEVREQKKDLTSTAADNKLSEKYLKHIIATVAATGLAVEDFYTAYPPPVAKKPIPETKKMALEITNPEAAHPTGHTEEKRPQPLPKESFTSWLQQFEAPQVLKHYPAPPEQTSSPSAPTDKNIRKKHRKKSEAEIIAERSLYENDEIISETLAELLVKQEQYEKAAQMFEKLSLKYPEKSALFAQRIENLKKI